MTQESPKAKNGALTLWYEVRKDRVEWDITKFVDGEKEEVRHGIGREDTLRELVDTLRGMGAKTKILVKTRSGISEVSQRTVEQLFHREMDAADLLI